MVHSSSQRSGGGRYPNREQGSGASNFQPPSETDIRKIIVEGDVELLVQWADLVGQELVHQRLSTNQIRNVYGTARQIQLRWGKPGSPNESQAFREAILLRPKLAYFAEREKQARGGGGTAGMETLQTVLEPALKLIGENGKPQHDRYQRFIEFFEAIVAYHKKYGGK
jgi:CRISPR-associated protein Csm2